MLLPNNQNIGLANQPFSRPPRPGVPQGMPGPAIPTQNQLFNSPYNNQVGPQFAPPPYGMGGINPVGLPAFMPS